VHIRHEQNPEALPTLVFCPGQGSKQLLIQLCHGGSGDEAFMKTCFPCHNEIKARDLVFTRYAQ
jgi:hypothetical protein